MEMAKATRSFRCHKCRFLFEDRKCEIVFDEKRQSSVLVDGKKMLPCPNCGCLEFDWVSEEYMEEVRVFRLKPDTALRKMVSCTCKACEKPFYQEDKDVSCPHCKNLDYTVIERFTKGA